MGNYIFGSITVIKALLCNSTCDSFALTFEIVAIMGTILRCESKRVLSAIEF